MKVFTKTGGSTNLSVAMLSWCIHIDVTESQLLFISGLELQSIQRKVTCLSMYLYLLSLVVQCLFLLAWGNLANILKGGGRVDEAEMAYRNALSYRPNMADAHYNLSVK